VGRGGVVVHVVGRRRGRARDGWSWAGVARWSCGGAAR
jgi:hypothetical protein